MPLTSAQAAAQNTYGQVGEPAAPPAQAPPPPAYPAEPPLPKGWEEMTDPNSGKKFYVNHLTKSTTWERPKPPPAPKPAPAAPPAYHAVAPAYAPAAPVARPVAAAAPVQAYNPAYNPNGEGQPVAAAPFAAAPVIAKPVAPRRFTKRIVVGQQVRILAPYGKTPKHSIGKTLSSYPDGRVEVMFDQGKVGFAENEVASWLEPWGPELAAAAPARPFGQPARPQFQPARPAVVPAQPAFNPAQPGGPRTFVFNEAKLGFNFKLNNGMFTVIKVWPNSAAWKHGVRMGMKMVSVSDGTGQSVQGSTADMLAKHLRMAPRPVSIVMMQGAVPKNQAIYARNAQYKPSKMGTGAAVGAGVLGGALLGSLFAGSW